MVYFDLNKSIRKLPGGIDSFGMISFQQKLNVSDQSWNRNCQDYVNVK